METTLPAIWPLHEAFYIESMLFNSTSGLRSIALLHSVFEKLPPQPSLEDIERLPTKVILNELQNVVLQGAALSRYFWPVKKGHETRAVVLREAFSVGESSPLFSRALRNALEHFDERLDNYLASGIVGYVFPEYVGLKPTDDGVPGHFFRAYFVDHGAFRLLDEEFLMEPLAVELQSIHQQLIAMDENGGRLSCKDDKK